MVTRDGATMKYVLILHRDLGIEHFLFVLAVAAFASYYETV